MIVVGISGVARSGKNLLCDLLMQNLYIEGYTSKQFALASDLKNDCDEFLYKMCDLNVWTDLTEDKTQFREFLVWYGSLKRKQTNGRYWIEKLDRRISTYEGDVAFVTDVRYDSYEKDEVHWIKEERQGLLIHLKRFTRDDSNSLQFTKPANQHEYSNDGSLYTNADINITWETVKDPKKNDIIIDVVNDTTKKIIEKIKNPY
ncbi:MAG: hypothetical protein CMP21_03520 [Rickettsiales bacterium]|nr:hypothetical protein [Rickettsiales bacterium]|tara:strand:+ start:20032 stop:20640 length:609 start_codon:yes stop_codon:yes gene_type:complete